MINILIEKHLDKQVLRHFSIKKTGGAYIIPWRANGCQSRINGEVNATDRHHVIPKDITIKTNNGYFYNEDAIIRENKGLIVTFSLELLWTLWEYGYERVIAMPHIKVSGRQKVFIESKTFPLNEILILSTIKSSQHRLFSIYGEIAEFRAARIICLEEINFNYVCSHIR